MKSTTEASAAPPRTRQCAPLYAPLLLAGCSFGGWWRILVRNGFRLNWRFWPALGLASVLIGVQSLLSLIQRFVYGARLREVRLAEPPIFIIGHWRTGTTLLHYLLTQDERHIGSNSYECFAPNHFVLTERWFMKLFGRATPFRRPMDNMLTSFQSPQEDEFALMLRGQPSLYWSMVFPNHPAQDSDYLDLEKVPDACRDRWKRAFRGFLSELTYLHGKRLVLKNPLHGARIRLLLEMFPGARFVNLVRDPYVVFPSTLHMHKTSTLLYAWQKPSFAGLEERVFEFGNRLHAKVEDGKSFVPAGQLHELRYEQLVSDPIGEMRKLYAALGLGEFAAVEPRLKKFVESYRGYQTNTYQIRPQDRLQVTRQWSELIRRQGYGSEDAVESAPKSQSRRLDQRPGSRS